MKKKRLMTVYGDGVRDDTEALQAYANGEADLVFPDGRKFEWGSKGIFLISKTIHIPHVRWCDILKEPTK